jgi:large subunit ribosomal protein L15
MKLHQLFPHPSERKSRKRRGRGPGSGLGCTAGKGNKGQRARAGSGPATGFEGGQMPLSRRLPKRGFTNTFKVRYSVLNVEQLERLFPDRSDISLDDLYTVCSKATPVKILGRGELSRPVSVEAHRFSRQAREKIEAAGGQVKALEG